MTMHLASSAFDERAAHPLRALPRPTNRAASGALRLHATRATGSMPAVWASWPSSSSSASKWGRPRSTPTRTVEVVGRSEGEVKPETGKG